jgi:hypothetical protein
MRYSLEKRKNFIKTIQFSRIPRGDEVFGANVRISVDTPHAHAPQALLGR